MVPAIFITQDGNGGVAMKKGTHASQKTAGGGSAATNNAPDSNIPNLPEGVSVSEVSGDRTYEFRQEGKTVEFTVVRGFGRNASHSISFYVDGTTNAAQTGISSQGANEIAAKVGKIMKADAATRPDGFRYDTTAAFGDGRGMSRRALYGRAGFSLPASNDTSGTQRAVVKGGKLVPADSKFKPLGPRKLKQHQKDVREAVKEGARARRAAQRAREMGLSRARIEAMMITSASGGPSIDQQLSRVGAQ